MMLSVLIPTMPHRKSLLSRCLYHLLTQPGLNDTWEVLCYNSDGKTGDKINTMIDYALGDYTVIVDDDDWVSSDYITQLLPHLDGTVDAVGFDIAVLVGGVWESRVRQDPELSGWEGYNRGFCHKNPVRRALAGSVLFGNEYQDDATWAAQLEKRIGLSAYVPKVLYYYDYQPVRHVGWWPHDPSTVRWL